MTLKTALEIGKDCGLTYVGEALYNIRLHSMNIFVYGEETKELEELYNEVKATEFSKDTTIEYALNNL